MIIFRIGLTFVNTTTIAKTFHAGGRRTDLAPCRRKVSSVKVKVVKVATWKIIGVLLMMLKSPKKNTCHFFFGGEWLEHRYMLWKMSCGSVPSIDRAFHGLPCQSVSKLSWYVVFVSQTWWSKCVPKMPKEGKDVYSIQGKMFHQKPGCLDLRVVSSSWFRAWVFLRWRRYKKKYIPLGWFVQSISDERELIGIT